MGILHELLRSSSTSMHMDLSLPLCANQMHLMVERQIPQQIFEALVSIIFASSKGTGNGIIFRIFKFLSLLFLLLVQRTKHAHLNWFSAISEFLRKSSPGTCLSVGRKSSCEAGIRLSRWGPERCVRTFLYNLIPAGPVSFCLVLELSGPWLLGMRLLAKWKSANQWPECRRIDSCCCSYRITNCMTAKSWQERRTISKWPTLADCNSQCFSSSISFQVLFHLFLGRASLASIRWSRPLQALSDAPSHWLFHAEMLGKLHCEVCALRNCKRIDLASQKLAFRQYKILKVNFCNLRICLAYFTCTEVVPVRPACHKNPFVLLGDLFSTSSNLAAAYMLDCDEVGIFE